MKKLILLPNVLGTVPDHTLFLPASVDPIMEQVQGLIAESESGGRRFLKRFATPKPAHQIPLALLNEHTKKADLDFILEPIEKGECWPVISDAGLPCLADPGALLVSRARQKGIEIEAHSGPSSITLGLMLSGFPAQEFAFHGYLSRDPARRKEKIQEMELHSTKKRSTQIFIEAPYRNTHTLQALVEGLRPSTKLCVAWSLTTEQQGVLSLPVSQWRKRELPDIHKVPTIFLLLA